MYRGVRRRKEDQRKAKQEAKRARKAERRETGATGPEIAELPDPGHAQATEFVWFSPGKGRTVSTPGAAPPTADGIDDWTLIGEPPAGG